MQIDKNAKLGLDIGTNSVGSCWKNSAEQFVDLAVSIFEKGTSAEKDIPKNQERRGKRHARRQHDRHRRLMMVVRQCLVEDGLEPIQSSDVWKLRHQSTYSCISSAELGCIIYHIINHRGPSNISSSDDDGSQLKEARNKLVQSFNSSGYPTVGSFLYHQIDKIKPIRNRLGNFNWIIPRDILLNELKVIWKKQKEFGAILPSIKKYEHLLIYQRPISWDRNTINKCPLEPTDIGVSACDMYFCEYRLRKEINNITIDNNFLTVEQKDLIYNESLKTTKNLTWHKNKKHTRIS